MARERARAKEIVARLRAAPESADEVFTAFEELDALPAEVVREALEPWLGPAPDPERLELDDGARRALRLPPRRPRLVQLAVVRDADIFDLGEVAEQQVRAAGKSWDGADLEAFERLDEEVEGSFAGTLEHVVLGEGAPMFDVVRFLGDAGVVFRTGTLERVGFVADGRVEVADSALRVAIEEALASRPVTPPEEPAVAEEPPSAKKPKRAAVKSGTKKKSAAPKRRATKSD